MVATITKKPKRTLDERIAELTARKERDEKRARTIDALNHALQYARECNFGAAFVCACKAAEILAPADATEPLVAEGAAK